MLGQTVVSKELTKRQAVHLPSCDIGHSEVGKLHHGTVLSNNFSES